MVLIMEHPIFLSFSVEEGGSKTKGTGASQRGTGTRCGGTVGTEQTQVKVQEKEVKTTTTTTGRK